MPARTVHTDLDGRIVGPRGSSRHAADGTPTLEPAAALADLHRAGIPRVLVSGRTAVQLVEAARISAADGFVAEPGSLVGWSGGWETHLLSGELPAEHAGRAPLEVMAGLGVVDALLAEHPGRLEWHAPWHADRTADAVLRGRVDPLAVDAWLAEREPEAARGPRAAIARDLQRRRPAPDDAVVMDDSVSDLELAPAVRASVWCSATGRIPRPWHSLRT